MVSSPRLRRLPLPAEPAQGLLRLEHFQVAYVTNDFDAACALFSERFGIGQFAELGGAMPAGGEIRAAFAWVGTVMYEIIWARGPGSELYMDRVPAGEGLVLRHHHLGFLIESREDLEAVVAKAEASGWPIAARNTNPYVEVCFVEVPELGHYLEYLYATPAGLDFFDSVPRS